MKKPNLIILVGACLIALRLIFPVLQCNYTVDSADNNRCQGGQVVFFSFKPMNYYSYHENRTNSESMAIGVLTIALYFIFRNKKKSK
jgi:hypothetical protein